MAIVLFCVAIKSKKANEPHPHAYSAVLPLCQCKRAKGKSLAFESYMALLGEALISYLHLV